MRVRGSLVVLAIGAVALAVPLPTAAQSSGKNWRIGMLSLATPASSGHVVFVQALRERGYVEGQSLTIVYRYAEGRAERLPGLAAELVGAKVDVIVTAGTVTAIAARKAIGSIPIVALINDDPVAAGLAASLARPGGNVTGVVLLSSELAGKRLELLKEMLPRVSRVGVLTAQGSEPQVEEMQGAAQRLGVHLVRLDVGTADEVDRGFERARKNEWGLSSCSPRPSSRRCGSSSSASRRDTASRRCTRVDSTPKPGDSSPMGRTSPARGGPGWQS